MRKTLLLVNIILILGVSALPSSAMGVKLSSTVESLEYTFKPLTIIRDPLFSRPSLAEPGNMLNISLELAAEHSTKW